MRIPRWFRPLALATAAFLVSAYPTLLEAQGQGQGQGRPSFPPGLHDRTLPPGKPFDGGDFQPPGRRGATEDDVERLDVVAARLGRLLADPAFPAAGTLPPAVDAFNTLVLRMEMAELQRPSESFLTAHRTLRAALADNANVNVNGDMAGDGAVGAEGTDRANGANGAGDAAGSTSYPIASAPIASAPIESAPIESYLDQDTGLDELRRAYYLPGGTVPLRQQARPWMIPGMAAATPIGFGANFGTVWAGASYQPRARYSEGQTGAAAVGFGLGDAERLVGLQVAVNSFSTISSGFGKRMALDLHLHRQIGDLWSVAVGWESVAAPTSVTRDSRENLYAAGSRWLQLRGDPDAPFGLAMLSLGVGSGRFQTEARFVEDAGGVGLFGSFGIRVAPPVTFIAEWTGQDVLLATSVTPLRNQRLAITAGFAEVTGAAGDGARFTIGGSLGYSFR